MTVPSFTVSAGHLISRSGAIYSPESAMRLASIMIDQAASPTVTPVMAGAHLSDLNDLVNALRLLEGEAPAIPINALLSRPAALSAGGDEA